uniref:Uncharacterized protein n=1 Tax=viral metagenome TaxID=1070528 RepID=A0A6M3LBQ8_9ZZZZ
MEKLKVKILKWLISWLFTGYSLHRNPPKGIKKKLRMIDPPWDKGESQEG